MVLLPGCLALISAGQNSLVAEYAQVLGLEVRLELGSPSGSVLH